MGLLSALSNAVSGLNVNQQNLNVLSQNISNANTSNYSHEVVNQQAQYDGGLGTGVSVESITRTVNQYLSAEVQSQTSVNSAASTSQSYYSQIENLLGQPGTSGSIDQGIDSFFTAIQDLANSPSVSTQTVAVNSAVTAASQISGLASSLQSLRFQADSQISSSINSVNTDLQTLFTTNASIERASATGQSTVGLLDQRDASLSDLAQYVDISPTYSSDGEVTVNTTNGLNLLTDTTYSSLSYTPATSAQTFVNNQNLSPIDVTTIDGNGNTVGNPVTLATGGQSTSVTTSLTGGSIQGLLNIRDSVIPNILNQLDQLSSSMVASINTIANKGSSAPPPNSYTGTQLVSGGTPSQWSGNLQLAVLDSNGNPVASPYPDEPNGLQSINLNLSTLQGTGGTGSLTTDDIINAINQSYGTPQNKTELGSINNIQLGVLSSSVPAAGNTLNVDFNLNNISSTSAPFYVTGMTVLDSSGTALPASDITSSVPSISVASYVAGTGSVTVNTSGANTLTNGQTVYLNTPSTTVGGQTLAAGYYTVSNATGTSFDVALSGATADPTPVVPASAATASPPYDTVQSGQTLRTGSNGSFTISGLTSGTNSSAYYTVEANVATVDATGNIVTSTITYTIPNNTNNTLNNLIGANTANGRATVVAPNTNQPLVTASLVDANGNPLPEINGSYGNQQGYLKITADNSSYTVAINQSTSVQGTTNQGFSQYFGLNNIFNTNYDANGNATVPNSAINLSVESRIVSNPSLIPVATLSQGTQPSADSTLPPNFTYVVAAGDNSISQQLAALANTNESYSAIGGMPASSTTFSQYAGQILAKTSDDSTTATNTATDSQTLLTGYTTRAQAVSGVNLDQELANTVIYQNAYSASTRVITVVSNMFDQLLGIIQ